MIGHCWMREWCPGAESNHRHADFQSAALPLSYLGFPSRERRVCRDPFSGVSRHPGKRGRYSMRIGSVQRRRSVFGQELQGLVAVRQSGRRRARGQAKKPVPAVQLTTQFPGKELSSGPAAFIGRAGRSIGNARRTVVGVVLVVAAGDDVGALEPAVEVDVLAARRAERIGARAPKACRIRGRAASAAAA